MLVATIDAQWEGMGDVRSARYKSPLLPPCPTIRACKLQELGNFQKFSTLRVKVILFVLEKNVPLCRFSFDRDFLTFRRFGEGIECQLRMVPPPHNHSSNSSSRISATQAVWDQATSTHKVECRNTGEMWV